MRLFPATVAFCLAALGAHADTPEIRAADQGRLADFDGAFGAAMQEALAGGDINDLDRVLIAMAGIPGDYDPAGTWKCRTIKMGGLTPLVAYAPFDCRVTKTDGDSWRIEKLTGSQRLVGRLDQTDAGLIYTGVGFVDGGPAMAYEQLPPGNEPVEPGQTIPQVGYFVQTADDNARLMLPRPIFESTFDILHFTR
ncbi:DUF4893 domain-containing protein [Yoonia sp. SS1-5]|uniref:DUF4893 domain-containing protein n=1 Tax=Yoonia rhodophyticola TaxID=3137370 RepID=A0AAN0MK05_9RHOB